MAERFQVAVIGLGEWARRAYLPNIGQMADVAVSAVSTRSESNLDAALPLMGSSAR